MTTFDTPHAAERGATDTDAPVVVQQLLECITEKVASETSTR